MSSEWDDDTKVSPDERKPTTGERDRAYLIVLAGGNLGEMFKVGKTEIVLGRGQNADVPVLDEGVSRRHAVIRLVGEAMVIEDVGSRNGTWVNGERITAARPLVDGDKIQVGSTTILKFTYHDHLDESFQKRMFESALRDGLTRAFNKKYFTDRMESEFRFARRHRVPLALIMLDIDHFKAVNDAHGHLAGDQVLSSLARRIQENIRNEDVFARYGGEEFALLCRAIEVDNAQTFAERLRRAVGTMECQWEDRVIPVTISLGVAGLSQIDSDEPVGLLSAADDALYRAKRAGRNRVCVFGRDA